jgi:hypothetical protein
MNFASMQTALLRYGFDVNDPVQIWLNAAMHDFEAAFDWPFLEVLPYQTTLNIGANGITLPSDAGKVIYVKDMTNLAKLKYYDRHKFVRVIQDPTDVGQAEVYTLVGTNQLQFWRVLQSATTFEVMYQALCPDMVNPTDVPGTAETPFPEIVHYAILQCAAAIALQAENEEDRATTALQQYQASLMRFMGKFGERELDEPTTVEDEQGYGSSTMSIGGLGSW